MKRLHPITRKQEVPVDIEIAAVVRIRLRSKRLKHVGLVKVLSDPVELLVAQATAISALDADIVGVLARSLIGADYRVVAVD